MSSPSSYSYLNKRCIFCAYAHDPALRSGANVEAVREKVLMYLKNTAVALLSAKSANPECDAALVTNVDLPQHFEKLFAENGIRVFRKAFDSFCFGPGYAWGLAFYKLCALKEMLQKPYDSFLLLDTDTYTQSSLDDLWEEAGYNILLYDINHRLSNRDCAKFNEEVKAFIGMDRPITNYGGEFIAGSRAHLSSLMVECEEIYGQMIQRGFETSFGDEFILRIAADKMRDRVKNAGAYVYRFWTGTFYLVSTCYEYNAVSVLHVPAEKTGGMIRIYDHFLRYRMFPRKNRIYAMLHLRKKPLRVRLEKRLSSIRRG